MRLLRSSLLAGLVVLAVASSARADSLLSNGRFTEWRDGLPAGWTTSEGARADGVPSPSRIERVGETGGVALSGSAKTTRWRLLGQRVAIEPGSVYRLRFEARASGLKREERQWNSCYVGVSLHDADGRRLGIQVVDVAESSALAPGELTVRAPAGASAAEVAIFISKTGRLEVASVELARLEPRDSFATLVAAMDRHYSYFPHRGVDWDALVARHRETLEPLAADRDAFLAALVPMLAELGDAHIWIERPDGQLVPTFTSNPAPNYDFQLLARAGLDDVRQIGRIGFTGRSKTGGFGYIAIGTLAGDGASFARLEEAFVALLDAPGLIIDLRANQGGDERRAQRLAARLVAKRTIYAKAAYRRGPAHDDLGEPQERAIEPAAGATPFAGPIACLTGPQCMSSGEDFALMLGALPNARLFGLPTRGASGNPAPVALPNGLEVWFSRWVAMDAEGTVIEGRGVLPDQRVEHRDGDDPTFATALVWLGKPRGDDEGR